MRKTWENVGVVLHGEVENAIKSLNFPTMTPIQSSTIPQLINKKDVVAEAVTGSGKTLAFVIPILEILKRREAEDRWKKYEIGALIVSPTRELALQTKDVVEHLLKFTSGLTLICFIGGNSIEQDLHTFKNVGGTIVICTPGRFEDLLQRKSDINLTSSLKSLEILILDEADKLLDYGFKNSVDTILSYLPRQRRTGLFSATQTKQVQDLIRAGLRNPVLVSVSLKAVHSTPETLNNYYIVVNKNNKLTALLSFMQSKHIQKAMLFLPTCATVDYWSEVLPHIFKEKINIPIFAIHGKMKMKRKNVLENFRKSPQALLLCTDVMARGIDIPEVDWVLQWDPPTSASAFVHRVGRTARQGHQGASLILLLKTEEAYVNFIEKNQRVNLEQLEDLSEENCAHTVRETLQRLQLKDRELMEKATRAFVSHVRAYSKHECSLLLRVKELPMGSMASTYGLLHLPKMPELKDVDLSDFKGVDVDLNSICYKDKNKEAVRKGKLEVYKQTGSWPGRHVKVVKKPTQPWSLTKQKKIDKREKKLKRKRNKEAASKAEQEQKKRKRKKGISEEDLKELAENIALLKKMKKEKT